MNTADITPMILTFNERENIEHCLQRLRWAREVIVVDSFSTDGTPELVRAFPNARVVSREFDCAANQGNFGLSHVTTPWVLSLDADYLVPIEFSREVEALPLNGPVAFAANFRYHVFSQPLRGTLYPPRKVLYQKSGAQYITDGHTQRLQIVGECKTLSTPFVHDDHKPLARWFASQAAYAALEAEKLRTAAPDTLRLSDRVRQWRLIAPWINLGIVLFAKGIILDGWRGWYYALQRLIAELMISASLIDHDLRSRLSK